MKKALLLFLALLLCFLYPAVAEESSGRLITPEGLQACMDTNPYINLFDLRDADAYAGGHLPYAVSTPLAELRDIPEEDMAEITWNNACALYGIDLHE